MTAERVVGSLLLGIALVCAVALVFVPLGTAWTEPAGQGVRTTETYRLITKDVDSTTAGTAAEGSNGATWYYVDETLSGNGLGELRAAGPLMAGAAVLAFVALLLTAIRPVNATRAGGIIALPASALFLTSIVAMIIGTQQHAASNVAASAQVNFTTLGTAITVVGVLSLCLATGLGLARATAKRAAQRAFASPTDTGRRLRCPECSTVVMAPPKMVPICPTCDFGADYVGRAGPVPAPAVPA